VPPATTADAPPPLATRVPALTSAGLWPTGAGTAPKASPLPMTTPSALSLADTPVTLDSGTVDSIDIDAAEADKTEPIGEPLAFVDTATGETIIVRFVRPLRPDRLIGPR